MNPNIKTVELITTEGQWLSALIAFNGITMNVMDAFSSDDGASPKPGESFAVELTADDDDDESWESIFSSNPDGAKKLVHLKGWEYRAYGDIISIDPVVVDCGIMHIEDVVATHDPRVVGESVSFNVSRITASMH